ncbi:MAG: helix-turn-helix domain-containing protein [Planctomycetaceae bacterium]
MHKSVSPRQVARAIGVSESTLKRWCDRGLIPMTKTAGGHRRIETRAVLQFLRESGREIVEPELLGLPVSSGKTDWTLARATDRILAALIQGEESAVRQIVFDLLLADHPVSAVFDDVLTQALHSIGDRWSCGEAAIYEERRACGICMRLLHELRASLADPGPESPVAVGGTLAGDIYTIPVTMAETVLRSAGWKATALGANLPVETLLEALESCTPRLFWISVSYIHDETAFVTGVNQLLEASQSQGAALVIGGRAVTSEVRRRIQYSAFCESFSDLEHFARSLNPSDRNT